MTCNGTPAVTFNYTNWVAIYSQFAAVSEQAAQGYFDIATLYCANRLGPVRCLNQLTTLLYMLTAHVAWLYSPRDAQGNPSSTGTQTNALVGRINSATEGSVSVQTENLYAEGTAQWYQQTPWGSAYWAATAIFRTMRYRPGVRRPLGFAGTPWLFPNGS